MILILLFFPYFSTVPKVFALKALRLFMLWVYFFPLNILGIKKVFFAFQANEI